MKSQFEPVLSALTRQRGVTGCMVVSEADGIIVDSNLSIGMKGKVVAALAASLYRKARHSASAAGFGNAQFLQLEAQRGHVCAVGQNDLVIVTVAESRANVGLIRVEMMRQLSQLG